MNPDLIVMRHSATGAPHLLAREVSACVINAGDGINEHPTQALLDLTPYGREKGASRGSRWPSSVTSPTAGWRDPISSD